MPVIWEIRHSVLIVKAIGDDPSSELIGAIEAAMRDPRFGAGTPVLFDARSSLTYLSPEQI